MLQQDYIIRMIVAFAAALREALETRREGRDNDLARYQLETAIGTAADMDPSVLLALTPDSVANILLLGSLPDSVAEYIVHSLELVSSYYAEDGYKDLSVLRKQQGDAVAAAFSLEYDPSRLDALLNPLEAKDEEEQAQLEAQYLERGEL